MVPFLPQLRFRRGTFLVASYDDQQPSSIESGLWVFHGMWPESCGKAITEGERNLVGN